MTDSDRIRGFLSGTRPQYDEIVGWITVVVRSHLWEEHVPAEDVIADTVAKLLVALRNGAFRADASLKTYVQQITLYTLVDATRRQRRYVALDATADVCTPGTPLTDLEAREDHARIERALAMLPDNCRELFLLVLEEKLRCREIADRLGTTEGAIKTRLSRCRHKAKELMERMR